MTKSPCPPFKVAICAPRGRDAAVANQLLMDAGIRASVMQSVADIPEAMQEDLGVVLVTEEALQGAAFDDLQAALEAQESWSDLPFIVLTNDTERQRGAAAMNRIDALNNAVLLARPLHADAILRAVRSGLKARRRQYEARDRLLQLEQREAELRESEQKFLAITNSVDQMIWSTTPDGAHDYFNDRWYEFTGVPHGSTDGEGWNGVFHPEDQQRAWARWRHSLETGEAYHIEYRLRHRSGQYRWVLGRAQPVRDPAGNIVRWYGSCTDIHEQVVAREAMADYNARLEKAVAARTAELADLYTKTPVMLHSLDKDGCIVDVSDRWLAFMGFSDRSEVQGRSIVDFIAPESLEAHEGAYRRELQEQGVVEDLPYVCLKSDGSTADVLVSARIDLDHKGELAHVMASVVDVTEKLKAEADRDRAEAALRQSQKLETIGQLTGGVAHDFNNLLMAIRSSLSLIERRLAGKHDDKTDLFIANAIKATERGASLTQRMLAFARKQDLNPTAVDIPALLRSMEDLLERSIGPQVELDFDLAGDLPMAQVDANQLEMALLNLALNGRDAMNGVGTLRFGVALRHHRGDASLAAGEYVVISVTDTGEGMDEATLAQAMEPFFTTKGTGKGTGLGLPMVYGLATQSGGTITMESTPGQGTRAEIWLPRAGGDAAAQATDAPRPDTARRAGSRHTILAVDDDALVLMGTVGLMEDLGHDVLEATSGSDALKLVEAHPEIDLVITDHAMPKMTGIQLAEAIRALRPELPVVLASGYAEMPEGGERHIAQRLEKPFSDTALERVLRQMLPTV